MYKMYINVYNMYKTCIHVYMYINVYKCIKHCIHGFVYTHIDPSTHYLLTFYGLQVIFHCLS